MREPDEVVHVVDLDAGLGMPTIPAEGRANWACLEVASKADGGDDWTASVHVIPLYGPAHELVGVGCWCRPTTERMSNGDDVVVHRDAN